MNDFKKPELCYVEVENMLDGDAIKLLHRQNPNRLYICGDLIYRAVYEDGFRPNSELMTISLKLLSRCDRLILVNFDDIDVWQTTLWASAKTAGIPIEYYNGTFSGITRVDEEGNKCEMEIKMTDNLYEFRKLVLKDLIKEEYKYIARDKDGIIYAFSNKPIKNDGVWNLDRAFADGNKLKDISLVSALFADIEWKDIAPFKIPYTNWKEVPVDTPVVYTNGDGMKYARHFCKYDETNDRVVLYEDGRTSFTAKGIIETCPEKVSIYGEEERNVIQGEAVNVLMV